MEWRGPAFVLLLLAVSMCQAATTEEPTTTAEWTVDDVTNDSFSNSTQETLSESMTTRFPNSSMSDDSNATESSNNTMTQATTDGNNVTASEGEDTTANSTQETLSESMTTRFPNSSMSDDSNATESSNNTMTQATTDGNNVTASEGEDTTAKTGTTTTTSVDSNVTDSPTDENSVTASEGEDNVTDSQVDEETDETTTMKTTTSSTNTASSTTTTATSSSSSPTSTTTTTTTTVDPATRTQRALYPYGIAAGDEEVLKKEDDYYWVMPVSKTINFKGGFPFGSETMKVAHVLPNGAITFGSTARQWWPSLRIYSWRPNKRVLAPFWFYHNPRQNGSTFYHLYEQNETQSVSNRDVLDRASNEVKEQYGLPEYQALTVLVATWVDVEPYAWYTWLCYYFKNYPDIWWLKYYLNEYNRYCLNETKETNTFQAVCVSDGETSYTIVTYKEGQMKWVYERWRRIVVGFVNAENSRDFGVTYTDLTDVMDSLTWNTGRAGTWIEKIGKKVNPDSRCLNFFFNNINLIGNSTHQEYIDGLFKCPCTMDRIGRQWWSFSWTYLGNTDGRTYRVCYALSTTAKRRLQRLNGNPLNKLCCYRYTYPSSYWWSWSEWREARRNAAYIPYNDPNAGHLLLNDPWWWWGDGRKSRREDFLPRDWCCIQSSRPSQYCFLFNQVRPDLGCSLDAEFVSGRALGDPHIKTLDGRDYTFNGLGEYILLSVSSEDFSLQARTEQTKNNGTKTDATVFIAFAAKEGENSTFQVELDFNQTSMIIVGNGIDVTTDFYNDGNYSETLGDEDISIVREERSNNTVVVATFPSGISFEVYVGIRNLEFSINVPKAFEGKTVGLLGNFNGDKEDDFVLPNGNILTTNETNTERKIFTNFGKKWEVTSVTSVFTYPEGKTALDYRFPDFVPIFIEEVEETTVAEAKKLCGDDNTACIYDFIATDNQEFAEATKASNDEAESVKTSLANNLPELSVTGDVNPLRVSHGVKVEIQFSASDVDNDTVTFLLVNTHTGLSIDENGGKVTYTPDEKSPVGIGVQAKDSKGGLSRIVWVNLEVCPSCSGQGVCDTSMTRDEEFEGGKFVLNTCDCFPAYDGDDCDGDFNACLEDPCSADQNCTDLNPSEQGNSTIGYSCSECADGFELKDNFCSDINECIANGTNPVCDNTTTDCKNTVGSFSCECLSGFRKESPNDTSCVDIDECQERSDDCEQVCTNTARSFTCSCYEGNTLKDDKKTCDPPASNQGCDECKQVCIVSGGIASCSCKAGYTLVSGSTTDCEDINECEQRNKPCSQGCDNTAGGFTCSCYPGFELADDKVSCEECQTNYYGVECANRCVCNGHGTCSNIRGCECDEGWTGDNCNKDVDECQEDKCKATQICTNTLGSYECSCPSGYLENGDDCDDINECEDVLDHDCDLAVEQCENNQGSFSCPCRTGYARNPDNMKCEDIDECVQQLHSCEHDCVNTPGKYNCRCKYGFRLDSDRASCIKDEDVCKNSGLNCSHDCSLDLATNTTFCLCPRGYSLKGNEICEKIDECRFDHLNLCEYKEGCEDTDDGFTCSCTAGAQLDNDQRSCTPCGTGKWGINCANDCKCSPNAEKCDPVRGCVCKVGFTGDQCEKDIDECDTGLTKCEKTGEECVNTLGGSSCQCQDGYKRVGGDCIDIDECASVDTHNCSQSCVNYEGSFRCVCYAGYKEKDDKCEDVDECALNLDGCEQGCENSEGSYRCTCPDGLKVAKDGVSCEVATECDSNSCQRKCAKVNGKDTCFCDVGEELDTDGTSCKDVDLCKDAPCPGTCTETTDGKSFVCSCPAGQKIAADGFTCEDCTEGTYGSNCNETCACVAANTESCNKVNGVCNCRDGWKSGGNCGDDEDECAADPSPCSSTANSMCENTLGSHLCKCMKGYFKAGTSCTECSEGRYGEECKEQCTCDPQHSKCNKTNGNCICDSDWTGLTCDTDVDECNDTTNNCTAANKANWVCFNTPGSYDCGCAIGFEEAENGSCVDLNECDSTLLNECDQNCTNTPGNYTCSCNSGYRLGANGRSCDDINECDNSAVCEQICTNSEGSYECSCRSDYYISPDDKSQCFLALQSNFKLTLDIEVKDEIKEPADPYYKSIEELVRTMLLKEFRKTIENVIAVIINSMTQGSLIIDATAVVDKEKSPEAATSMVEALIAIAQYGVTFNGTKTKAVVLVGNLTVDADTDKCVLLEQLSPCDADEPCTIDASGQAVCKSSDDDDDDDIPLIVGLAVGLPLGIALIAAIVLAIWYKTKYKKEMRVNSRVDHYNNDNERVPTPDKLFGVGPSAMKESDRANILP